MQLLGVSICEATKDAIMAQVKRFLSEPQFHRIATVNPEFLVMSDRDPAFKQSLLSADLCVADGIGIVWAGWLQGASISRFPGTDLLHEVLLIAERDSHPVFLAVKKDGLSSYEEICSAFIKKYPGLVIHGMDVPISEALHSRFTIQDSRIMLCNFGAPAQELFLESFRNNPGDVRLAMGVGGAFDFLTGKQKRAPHFLRAIGLEWLWRLVLQPERWKRIWNAVIVFPVTVLFQKVFK